jgi:VWFA-related protein
MRVNSKTRLTRGLAVCAFVFCAAAGLLWLPVAAREVGQQQDKQQDRRSDDQEPVRIGATMVKVPAVVTDQSGGFVTSLTRDDFSVFEDGKRQEVSLFAAVKQPFSAVLVLDTSNSAQDRLNVIKSTALSFAREVRQDDRMMVVSFDNEVRELTDFTSDYAEIESAIKDVESGYGKLLYEAVARGLDRLKDVEGRRAVILLSDGVDMRSIEVTSEANMRMAEEIGAVIYVVRFDTRWWIESEARRQKSEHAQSDSPFNIDGRIPLPPEFGGPDPTPEGMPKPRRPRIEIGTGSGPPVIHSDGTRRGAYTPEAPRDEITVTLDKMYGEADKYMNALASRTGGRLFNAETFAGTQSAFAAIADELRNQYLIGYYPPTDRRDGKYRKIKIEVARKGVQVRARPGYRAPKEQ